MLFDMQVSYNQVKVLKPAARKKLTAILQQMQIEDHVKALGFETDTLWAILRAMSTETDEPNVHFDKKEKVNVATWGFSIRLKEKRLVDALFMLMINVVTMLTDKKNYDYGGYEFK